MDEDVNEILRISLPRKPRMDEVIRHFDEKKGIILYKADTN